MTELMIILLYCVQERPACIPPAVLKKRAAMEEMKEKRRTERDIELEEGDDYILDLRSQLSTFKTSLNNSFIFR